MKEFVRPLMGKHEKLFGPRKAVQYLNAPARGRPSGTVQVIRRFDGDATSDDGSAQNRGPTAGITGGLSDFGERLAIGLREILSRDSAIGLGNAGVVGESDTCIARIRGALETRCEQDWHVSSKVLARS